MSLIYNHAQTPPEGYQFPDPSGYMVKGKDLKDLEANIRSYRENNRFSTGNPVAELEAYYLKHHPWLVSKVGKTPTIVIDPIEKWIDRIWREAPKGFAQNERADRQEEICKRCPHYVSTHKFSKDSQKRLTILGAGKLRPMGVCSVHHLACGLAVILDDVSVHTAVDGCWTKKIV